MSTQNPTTVLIRYVDGQKKGQTEKFTVVPTLNITIGRGDANLIAFDPANDIISRQHCQIRVNPHVPDTYEITDLQSKNGTYVNGHVITGTTALKTGDTIRLGKEGPLLEFNLDPVPASHIKKTRVVDAVDISSGETKLRDSAPTAANNTPPKEVIGKQTMLHMIAQSEKKSRKGIVIVVAALLILMGTAGWLVYSNRSTSQVIHIGANTDSSANAGALSPARINKANETKVVSIELGWKLELTNTGEQLYHVYLPQKTPQGTIYAAAYVTNNSGAAEPWLSTQSAAPQGADLRPIGGFGTGTGFVVDERGFIMTNRHVATPWLTSYQFPPDAFPGLLVGMNEKGELAVNENVRISREQVSNWVPAEAMNYNRQLIQSGVKMIDGRSAYLDVTFANNSLRTPAKVVRISNVHDVAMIKIELPETLTKVEMFDNYNDIEPGSPVVVMGYPGMSPDQFVANRSQDAFNRNPNIVKVPVPTVSTGNIGRLVKGSSSGNKIDEYLSVMGDYYQLTINSTGPGNSGGPMFDEQGRVIGIYSAGNSTMSYSIPIKYAIELMGRQEVIQ